MKIAALEATAGEVMSSPPVVVSESTTLKEAAKLMIKSNIGCLPVVDEQGKLTGVVTERAFQVQIAGVKPDSALSLERRTLEELYVEGPDRMSGIQQAFLTSHSRPVSESMLTDPPTVTRDMPLWQVAERLLATHLSHLVVVQDGKPVGIIARHDLLRVYAGI